MKNQIIYCVLALCATLFLQNCSRNDDSNAVTPAVKTIHFVKTIGGNLNESATSITSTSDGGYAILGFAQSMNGDVAEKTNESFDFWLLKFNNSDELQWQKTYGGTGDDRGQSLISTLDGGYVVLGYSNSSDGDRSENFGTYDFWVLKLDSVGDIIWEKSFGFPGVDRGYKIIATTDGGFLATGVLDVSASNGQGNSKTKSIKHAGGDYWAIKLDANGEKVWSQFYGGTFTDTAYDIVETPEQDYIIIGSSDSEDVDISNNKGAYDFWVVKVSSSGDLIWEKSFGGSQIDEAWSIIAMRDGNYLITGEARSNDQDITTNNGAADIFVLKIDTNGTIIWQKTIGGASFEASRGISKTSDGGYIISGNSRSQDGDITENKGQNDALVLKLDANANIEWHKTIGGSYVDLAFDAIELSDGSIIAVGESSSTDQDISSNKGFSDLLMFKINK